MATSPSGGPGDISGGRPAYQGAAPSELSISYTVIAVCPINTAVCLIWQRFVSLERDIGLAFSVAGKDGVNILKSIDEGPFQMGTFRETLAEWNEGALHLGPERARVYSDLSSEDKDRYNADIQAKNILLQGLPKDIYTLINHYIDAKYIWDNVKMHLEGSKLTKEDRESQLYDDFEHFGQNKGETIHDYYVRFVTTVKLNKGLKKSNYDQLYDYLKQYEAHANENKMMVDRTEVRRTMQGEQVQLVMRELRTELGMQIRVKQDRLSVTTAMENGVVLDEEQLLFIAGGQDNDVDEDVDEPHVQDLALNVDNIFQADKWDAFDFDVDEAPTAQTIFMANLSSAYPLYDEAGPSYDSDILSEVYDHNNYQDDVCEHHEVHEMHDHVQPNCVVDLDTEYTGDSNMIPYDQYVKDNAEPVVQNNVSFIPNDAYMMIINEMHEQTAQCVSVKARTK
ncbi:hypothetical protein Tco_0060484 [Tanacetum coccineum]